MIKLSVCVETVFTDLPYDKRARQVARLGFPGIEFWHHDLKYDGVKSIEEKKDIEALSRAVKETGLVVTNFLLNSPDGKRGGSLVDPGDRKRYLERVKEAVPVARKLNCRKLTTCSGNIVEGMSNEDQYRSMIDTLSAAAGIVEDDGIVLILEPLNSIVGAAHKGHRGCFLNSGREGARIVREIDHKNIRLLFDIYHMQIMEGDIISTIESNIDIIAHIEGAGVPGRNEIWKGELDYAYILKRISELGYKGYFGLEYIPSMDFELSLSRTIESILS